MVCTTQKLPTTSRTNRNFSLFSEESAPSAHTRSALMETRTRTGPSAGMKSKIPLSDGRSRILRAQSFAKLTVAFSWMSAERICNFYPSEQEHEIACSATSASSMRRATFAQSSICDNFYNLEHPDFMIECPLLIKYHLYLLPLALFLLHLLSSLLLNAYVPPILVSRLGSHPHSLLTCACFS